MTQPVLKPLAEPLTEPLAGSLAEIGIEPLAGSLAEIGIGPAADPRPVRYSPSWLALREVADSRARARDLAALLAEDSRAGAAGGIVVHDLGCGTGSMARWLAPLLPGPQHWIMHDLDPELLALAVAGMPARAADGGPVGVEARRGDLTTLTAADLDGASLVTASALLDLLTAEEVDRLAAICAQLGCSVLFALSVAGRVELTPAEPLDHDVAEAFNAHQRRAVAGRRLLGPDAVAAARDAFGRCGARIEVRASPWHLGPEESALTEEWLHGWVGAAREQCPELDTRGYLDRRLAAARAGRLAVSVQHADLLIRFERSLSRPAPYQCVTADR